MSVRCTIDIEAPSVAELHRILSPGVPPPVSAGFTVGLKGPEEAIRQVCYEVCRGALERSKIPQIKRFRELTGWGLREAKDEIERLQSFTWTPES